MMTENKLRRAQRKRERSLLLALAWNVVALLLLAYRFTLPTDGWLMVEPDGFERPGFIARQNVMGGTSALQVGDWVTAVNGVPITNEATLGSSALLDAWQVGEIMQYSIVRDGQRQVVEVPLLRWPIRQYLRAVIFADLSHLFGLVGVMGFVAVSGYAFWQRTDDPAASALWQVAAALPGIFLAIDILPQSLADFFHPIANLLLGIIILSTFSLLLPPAFIRFGLVFPRPKPILAKRPYLAHIPYLIGTLVVAAFVLDMFVMGWLWTATAVLITLLLLLHNTFTMRDSISRGQMRWALGGIILGFALFSLTYVNIFFVESSSSPLGQFLAAFSGMGFAVMGIGLAVAVLRHHLFDIDLIVNRALVYAGLTLCVVAIYVIVVGYLSFLFQTETNLFISLLATGVVAVLFGRLRNWLQRAVNRLMYGQRDEPYQLLIRLGQQLETAVDPASALSLTVKTVAQALKLPYVAIVLQQGEEKQVTAVYGAPQNNITTHPLTYAGQPIGELLASSREVHEPLTPADQRLLSDLSRQLGAAAHAVLLTANLEQARLRLVTERGEARRQLGSDLHDGLGHQLVGLTRQLERTLPLLPGDPAQAESQLREIQQQLAALTGQVRTLAHRLYPPELELLGLVGAIQERTQTHTGVRVHLEAVRNLPPLPAEIETAVYYITLEALTNIEKHAQAQTCHIRLNLAAPSQPAMLHLEIWDDGHGAFTAPRGGLGLLSMQARAAEVGGSCVIGVHESGGTAVTVRIPCSQME